MTDLFMDRQNSAIKVRRGKALYLIPIILLLAGAGLFYTLQKDLLTPAIEVEIERVRTLPAVGKKVDSGKTLFQAAGWLEAAPYATRITALVDGIVAKVHCLEGQTVSKGELLVELIDEDLQLELLSQESLLEEIKVEKLVLIEEEKRQYTLIQSIQRELEANEAEVEKARDESIKLKRGGSGIAELKKSQARLQVKVLEKRMAITQANIETLNVQLSKIKAQLKLLDTKIRSQKITIDKRLLDIKRLKIHAPINGILQKVYAREGRKQMLNSDNPLSTTVAEIFDPKDMQVRVDVPLADAAALHNGMKCSVSLDILGDKSLTGIISSINGEADLQRNTLQVKVKLTEPQGLLRPEMLAQVKFLSSERRIEAVAGELTCYVPTKALIERTGAKAALWSHDLDMRLQKKNITVGSQSKDGWIEIIDGIRAGEPVLPNPQSHWQNGLKIKKRK